MDNITLRARIKTINSLVLKYQNNKEYSGLLALGFIPDNLKDEYAELLQNNVDTINDNSELSSYELSIYSTYLEKFPNKIIGKEIEGSSHIAKVKTIGNIDELNNLINFNIKDKKLGNIEEEKNIIEQGIGVIDDSIDDIDIASLENGIIVSNKGKDDTKNIEGVYTVQETIDNYNKHLSFEEIQGWVYYKRLFGIPMTGWENYFLQSTSKNTNKVVIANGEVTIRDNHFRPIGTLDNGTLIGIRTKFSNEYGGEVYWVCRTENNELIYVPSSKAKEDLVGNTANQEDIENLVKAKGLCYFKGEYVPIPLYTFGDIYEIEDILLGKIDNETKKRSGGDYEIIIEKFGKEIADFHIDLINDAKSKKGEFLFNDPRPSYRPFLGGTTDIANMVDIFYVRELHEDSGISFEKEHYKKYSKKRFDKDYKYSLKEAYQIWFEATITDMNINGTTKNDILNLYFKRGNVTDINESGKSDKDIEKEKDEKRLSAKLEGDRLFGEFLATALAPNDIFLLNTIWNREFNSFAKIDYSKVPVGFLMNKDVFSSGGKFKLKTAQSHGIAFLSLTNSGCLAHDVGYGKTITGILDISTKMAQGKIKRPLVIVPKPVYNNWIREMFGYWTDGNEKSFEKFNGAVFINGVLTGTGIKLNAWYNLRDKSIKNELVKENTVTLITYEGLNKIGFSKNVSEELMEDIFEALVSGTNNSERRVLSYKAKALKMLGEAYKKTTHDIDILGFDQITVDEAHNFKNIFSSVGKDNIWKIPSKTHSSRGVRLFIHSLYVQKKYNGNITLLTATPFTNSVLEIYSMLALSSFYNLKKYKFQNLYKFVETFIETQIEYGVNYLNEIELLTVIKSFKNKNILRELLYKVFDYKDNPKEAGVERPCKINFPNNKVKTYLNMSELQVLVQEEVRKIALEHSSTNRTIGRALAYAKANAISPYLFKSPIGGEVLSIPDDLEIFVDNSPKIKYTIECIRSVKEWHESRNEEISGQVIYSNRGIEIFNYIKEYMEYELGFKRNLEFGDFKLDEIEIIKGGGSDSDLDRKEAIKDAFNRGVVKVIIGTGTIKEGVNLQERGTVLYNLDIEWNPSDFAQLEGRIHRQKNNFGFVRIVAPLVVNTLDSFVYQKLSEKIERISSIWDKQNDSNNLEEYIQIDPMEIKMELMDDPIELLKMDLDKLKVRALKELHIAIENQKAVYSVSEKQSNFNKSKTLFDDELKYIIPRISRFLDKIDSFRNNERYEKYIIKIDELYDKTKEILDNLNYYIEKTDFKILFETLRQIKSRKFELRIELDKDSSSYLFIEPDYNTFNISEHRRISLTTTYSELKKIERLVLSPNNLTIYDDLSDLKSRLDGEVKKNQEYIDYLKSDEFQNIKLNEIKEKLSVKAENRGEVMDRVREFAETNYLLSYPFKGTNTDDCFVPDKEYKGEDATIVAKEQKEKPNEDVIISNDSENISELNKTKDFSTKDKLKEIENFIPKSQLFVMKNSIEEYEESIDNLYDIIKDMPSTYGQDGVKDPIVYLHYFSPGTDHYITEKDKGDTFENDKNAGLVHGRQYQAFGYSDIGYGGEFGYISIEEMRGIKEVNLDLWFEPRPLSKVKNKDIGLDNNDTTEGNDISDIRKFVEKNSWFEYEDTDEEDIIQFVTRKNGDVGSETHGKEDYKKAKELKNKLEKQFNFPVNIEVVDEWVHITVNIKDNSKKSVLKRISSDLLGMNNYNYKDNWSLKILSHGHYDRDYFYNNDYRTIIIPEISKKVENGIFNGTMKMNGTWTWEIQNIANGNLFSIKEETKDDSNDISEWKEAIETLQMMIEMGSTKEDISEWEEAIETLQMLI